MGFNLTTLAALGLGTCILLIALAIGLYLLVVTGIYWLFRWAFYIADVELTNEYNLYILIASGIIPIILGFLNRGDE